MIGAVIDLDRTREDCAARDARVDAMFDSLDDDFARIFQVIPEAGRREATQRTRSGDQGSAA